MKNSETAKQREEREKGLKKYRPNRKVKVEYCVECGKPVGEEQSMWNMHDYCRLEVAI